MALSSAQSRCCALGPILLAVGLLAVAGTARGQGGDGVHYSKQTSFKIPFQLDEGGRGIKQVLLHVSEDFGKTYELVHTVAPSELFFQFTAKKDGWYWFTVQTEDGEGRKYPPNPNAVQPGLKVCVDTQQPIIKTFRPVQPRDGTVAVEWEVQDENLDLYSLTLHYRAVGARDWTALSVQPKAWAQYGWIPAVSGPLEVRLGIRDKAQNYSEKIVKVTPVAGAGGTAGGNGQLIHVRSRRFHLNYTIDNVGPSAVKNVEVWVTQDTRSWQRYSDVAPAAGPFPVTVRTEGRYGFLLIPRSGVGLARKPPAVGEQPQVWVQVDETRPIIHLRSVMVSPNQPDQMTVNWTASDRHLRAQPITILYSEAADGPWKPLVGGEKLDNTGTCTLSTRDLPYQFYVRIEAADEAGNIGFDQRKESVKVDLKIPVVKSVKIEATPAPAAPGSSR
jgi:hypothetical protein